MYKMYPAAAAAHRPRPIASAAGPRHRSVTTSGGTGPSKRTRESDGFYPPVNIVALNILNALASNTTWASRCALQRLGSLLAHLLCLISSSPAELALIHLPQRLARPPRSYSRYPMMAAPQRRSCDASAAHRLETFVSGPVVAAGVCLHDRIASHPSDTHIRLGNYKRR